MTALASAILITTSEKHAQSRRNRNWLCRCKRLSRRAIIEESLQHYGAMIVCDTMDEAVAFANLLAPEHLEVCCREPMDVRR